MVAGCSVRRPRRHRPHPPGAAASDAAPRSYPDRRAGGARRGRFERVGGRADAGHGHRLRRRDRHASCTRSTSATLRCASPSTASCSGSASSAPARSSPSTRRTGKITTAARRARPARRHRQRRSARSGSSGQQARKLTAHLPHRQGRPELPARPEPRLVAASAKPPVRRRRHRRHDHPDRSAVAAADGEQAGVRRRAEPRRPRTARSGSRARAPTPLSPSTSTR